MPGIDVSGATRQRAQQLRKRSERLDTPAGRAQVVMTFSGYVGHIAALLRGGGEQKGQSSGPRLRNA